MGGGAIYRQQHDTNDDQHCYLYRAGDFWRVSSELGKDISGLHAKVETEEDKKMPPVQGWQYWGGGKWQSDPTLKTSRQVSKPCSEVLVELHGAVKERWPSCAGIYKPLKGRHNRGRWVLQNTSSKEERYLTVRTDKSCW